jgi:hypothetical protein
MCKLKGKEISFKRRQKFINIFMKVIRGKKLRIKTKIVIIIFLIVLS